MADKKINSSVVLTQEARGNRTVYRVKSLENRLTPAINSLISAGDAEKLIAEGVKVTVKGKK